MGFFAEFRERFSAQSYLSSRREKSQTSKIQLTFADWTGRATLFGRPPREFVMKPDSAHPLLSAFLDGELSPGERDEVEHLLSESPAARQELKELEQIRELLRQLPRENLPNAFASRILEECQNTSPEPAAASRAGMKKTATARSGGSATGKQNGLVDASGRPRRVRGGGVGDRLVFRPRGQGQPRRDGAEVAAG